MIQSIHRRAGARAPARGAALAALHIAFVAFAAAACSDSTAPDGPGGVFVVSGGGVTDTVLAPLAGPLVVEVRDESGRPASGVVVRFQAVPADATTDPWYGSVVTLHRTEGTSPEPTVFATTDGRGRASAWIGFGIIAAEGIVTINVPALGLDGRATYTVLPGNATGVRAAPADSAVYVDDAYAMRGAAIDRWGNARDDPVTYQSPGEHVRVEANGTLAGTSIGRDLVVVSRGEWRDTAWVSVVPRGRLAALKIRASTADTAALAEFELDGSGYRELPISYWTEAHPEWTPDGSLVHEDGGEFGESTTHLVVREALDAPSRRLVPADRGLQQEFHAQATADGAWIYFAGALPDRQGHTEIWRVRPDGTGAERIGEPSGYYEGDVQPSPSPDGSRVAYATDRHGCCWPLTLRMIDVATGAIDTLRREDGQPLVGSMPRWSPLGDVIAYSASGPDRGNVYANGIWTMRPDGSDRRLVSDPDIAYRGPVDWSPDGEWMVARSFDDDRLHLLHRATGLTLPLPFTSRLAYAAWQP